MGIVKQKLKFDVIYSSYDGGWYAEVYDPATGKELLQTKLFSTRAEAENAARFVVKCKANP